MMWQAKFDKWQKVWRNWTKPFQDKVRFDQICLGVPLAPLNLWKLGSGFPACRQGRRHSLFLLWNYLEAKRSSNNLPAGRQVAQSLTLAWNFRRFSV